MSRIDHHSRMPLYSQLKNILLERLGSNEYPVGSQIPTELTLMKEFKLCRATVRSALAELEREGRIEKKRGVGTFVCNQSQTSAFEPLMSLSFSLSFLGFKSEAVILENTTDFNKDKYVKFFEEEPNNELRKIKRLRYVDDYVLGIEETYLLEKQYQSTDFDKKNQSFIKAILNSDQYKPSKVKQTIYFRKGRPEEMELLNLSPDDKVLELNRCLYNDESSTSILSVHFVANARLISMAANSK